MPLLASAICAIGLTFTTSIQAAESETLSVSSDRVDAILALIGTKKYKEASALADSCIASGKTSGSNFTPEIGGRMSLAARWSLPSYPRAT